MPVPKRSGPMEPASSHSIRCSRRSKGVSHPVPSSAFFSLKGSLFGVQFLLHYEK